MNLPSPLARQYSRINPKLVHLMNENHEILYAVIGLMRVARTWDQFVNNLDIAFPKRGDTLKMPFMAEVTT